MVPGAEQKKNSSEIVFFEVFNSLYRLQLLVKRTDHLFLYFFLYCLLLRKKALPPKNIFVSGFGPCIQVKKLQKLSACYNVEVFYSFVGK